MNPDRWPHDQLAMLEELWKGGKTGAQIALALSAIGPVRTKNAVIGMVNRMGLVARPSPVKKSPDGPKPSRVPRVPRAPKVALPGPASEPEAREEAEPAPRPKAARWPGQDTRSTAERRMDTITGRARSMAAPAVLQAPLANVPYSRFRTCQWPEGTPKAEGFRFCGAPTVPGKPYCAEHCAKAYVSPRDRRSDAA